MEKRKVYGSIIGITLFVLLMLGLTYAALQWISPNNEETNVKLSVSKSLENFIVYVQGNSILSTSNQKLEQGTDYTSGISATIEFYKKDTNKPIYGRINMEILNMLSATNTTEANISKTNTVKWAITTYTSTNSTETLLNSGTFYGKQINDKFPLYQDFELSTTRTFFKIYIWFDENELDLDKSISNELLSTEISAEASDTIGEYSFPNSPDLVQGLIPVVYDESTSNWVKADSTNTDNSWYNYSDKRWANAVLVKEANFDYPITSKDVNISNQTVPAYTSSNQNQNSTTSTSTFTITTGSTAGTLSFDYAVSSESNYDKLTITVNGTTVANAISGEKSDTYSVSATANTTYTIIAKYVKDSSQSRGTDTATISNLTYPSGSTLSITPDATYPFNEVEVSLLVNKIASSFIYDTSTSKYTLKDYTIDTISSNTVGKYICPDTTQDTCSTMYKVTTASTTITKVEEYGTPTIHAVRSKYQNAEVGTVLNEEDILAFYVWIPRFKYKVWNISKQAGAESTYSYNAKTEGIDIIFEEGKISSGTISCNYNHNVSNIDLSTITAETCTGSNGDYYTHPAFTFGNDNVNGFWISKFEISSSNPTADYGGGNVTNLTVKILPNVNSWRDIQVSKISTVIQNMQTSSNIYGLSTSRANTDSHILTNMEWGAVAYLTNSKYGRCTNGSCTEVSINGYGEKSNYTTMTGCGPISSGSTNYGTTCNAYNTTLGQLASTTGNITGVYDMSGGAWEFTMGNISSASSMYKLYPSRSGFASSWYTTSTAKYVTTYAYDSSNYTNQIAYNRGRLGDATAETLLSASASGGWYGDSAYFPYSGYSWFVRGGYFADSTGAGVFHFSNNGGVNGYTNSSRAALVSVSA